jgi:hypothetical protein
VKTACVLVRGHGHQPQWCGAFAAGLKRHGWSVAMHPNPVPADLMVVWGVRRRAEISGQRKRGGEVCILERGYLGDRFKWTSVSFGGRLNGRAVFRGVRPDPLRFQKNFGRMLKDWRTGDDGYALLIGQVPGDMSLAGIDIDAWYRRTVADLTRRGYEVRFREHPQAVERGKRVTVSGAKKSTGSLQAALAGAALVVTFNSNAGVESVIAGVPTVTADEGSMAWPVTSHSATEEPIRPDRSEWASDLAWKQWTQAEIVSGECWAVVGRE